MAVSQSPSSVRNVPPGSFGFLERADEFFLSSDPLELGIERAIRVAMGLIESLEIGG